MPDDLSQSPAVAAYVASLHRLESADLGEHLQSILTDPADQLSRLSVFVPEVGLMLTRVMFLRDYEAVIDLVQALEGPLELAGVMDGRRAELGEGAAPEDRADVQYFLGRMVALVVCAKRFLLLDSLERLRQEHLDGGLSQAVLELLKASGARSQRGILTALTAQTAGGVRVRRQDLHQVLKRLVRDELMVQRAGTGRAQTLELTELGQQLLEAAPPWVDDVEEAYRTYRRLQVSGIATATQRSLVKLFTRLDREGGAGAPEPAAAPVKRAFPYADPEHLPPEDARGLPRIIP